MNRPCASSSSTTRKWSATGWRCCSDFWTASTSWARPVTAPKRSIKSRAHDPDVVLMDLHMPVLDGVEATRQLTQSGARSRVVVLTTWSDDASVFGALQAGARGYLTKDAGAEEIREAIRTVAAGEAQLDPSVQRRLIDALTAGRAGPATGSTDVAAPADGLTAREDEVLREIAQGRSNGEIARAAVRLGGDRQDARQSPARQDGLP